MYVYALYKYVLVNEMRRMVNEVPDFQKASWRENNAILYASSE
jgi:hypothetical protein